ncbi:hypothetical protein A3C73_03110 [Candidatus Giovannonibacteria bacterium RIFCSPHIGHO2_02_FULL_44_11]|nr:MAG: hypothetical protein A3C73_03110 [Candidatus Giovannonibacteria bacterium RIFCSPHIGHO2_02_FULL_44_11]
MDFNTDKRYECGGIGSAVAGFIVLVLWFLILAVRQVAVVFTGKDMLNWKDEDFTESAPSSEEIFEIARRICPKCGVHATDEAEEIGYHTGFNEKVFECGRCGTVFLGTMLGGILQNKNDIVQIQ